MAAYESAWIDVFDESGNPIEDVNVTAMVGGKAYRDFTRPSGRAFFDLPVSALVSGEKISIKVEGGGVAPAIVEERFGPDSVAIVTVKKGGGMGWVLPVAAVGLGLFLAFGGKK